jgi:hypothetical protein
MLTEYYEVDRETAARDVDKLVSQWLEAGIAE